MPQRHPETPENLKKVLNRLVAVSIFERGPGELLQISAPYLFAALPAGTCSIWFGVLVLLLNWLLLDCELEAP
jgi:hypothetical protein